MISQDDPRAEDVRALLEQHLSFARAASPPEDVHALDREGLLAADVSFFSLRSEGRLLSIGALKQLDATHAELKSMHTAAAVRGQGAGRAVLEHLLGVARDCGYERVSLETGSMAEFSPARGLYASVGFTECGPFADYAVSPHSTFMTLSLSG